MSTPDPMHLLRQYQRLVEVSFNLASNLEIDSLLKNIVEVASDLLSAEAASILLYDQHTHSLRFETATNAESAPILQKLSVPEESIAGWVALNRIPQIVNNVDLDNRHFANVDQQTNFSTRSLIAVPLLAKKKLVGVLEVLNKREGQFNQEDQEILQALAVQAAVAIENSRLFQQSDLFAEFAHELRSPLASIMTASTMLKQAKVADEKCITLANSIEKEARRLNKLTSTFLDFASLESGRVPLKLMTFSPRLLLKECLKLIEIKASEKSIQIHLEAPDNLPKITADREKLKQVLLNLLGNAVKYNRENGKVWLRASVEGGDLLISVGDTGLGIPQDQIALLFTRFFRARNVEPTTPGTGLGLPIARQIIEMHGGSIQVESEIDRGTVFSFKIPIIPNRP